MNALQLRLFGYARASTACVREALCFSLSLFTGAGDLKGALYSRRQLCAHSTFVI